MVLVGSDLVAALATQSLPRRDRVVVVATDTGDPAIWQHALSIGAQRVVQLPDEQPWLTAELARAREEPVGLAPFVAVVGACGGAGATSLAVALATTAARAGRRVVLLDGDPLGGGIDLAVGAENVSGPRWPELAQRFAEQRAGPALIEGLPAAPPSGTEAGTLLVVSWDRGGLRTVGPPEAAAVTETAQRTADLVVADLPRSPDNGGASLLERADLTLLVVPAEVRACAAAGRVAESLEDRARDLRLVVRGPSPGGLDAETIAGAVGLPLLGDLRAEPGLSAALDRGEVPGSRARGPLARFCFRLLPHLDGLTGRTA
jgi:secretion/DNA translocation related CpaE-like protein